MISLHTQLLFIITIRHVILFFPQNLASGQVSSAICDLGQARKPSTVAKPGATWIRKGKKKDNRQKKSTTTSNEKNVFIQKSFSTLNILKPCSLNFCQIFQTVNHQILKTFARRTGQKGSAALRLCTSVITRQS